MLSNHPHVLPAHHTKHLPLLRYPFRHLFFDLAQSDNGATNGTALWLVAGQRRLRAIELGSGVGLSALALSAIGWDVWSTDLPDVVDSVLMANVARNVGNFSPDSGSIHVRVLDWTVSPDQWVWDDERVIASPSLPRGAQNEDSVRPGPPFDLIISSDTLYTPDLVSPLLRALHALSALSCTFSPYRSPPVYLCIERRDSSVIDQALYDAKHVWNFTIERVAHRKLVKAMEKGGVKWSKEEWEGIEIWKLTLNRSTNSC
ncbi:predicted protein [Sparassis crispa]|uniref:Uncharacterized protein n=1 Tax=Sparassis crispa TaxID=139825 RepID=A0A401GIH9_9APHY|nr:predicted protein [Sparassis crispa]GBE82010.1 predicted protein [Sparassis crispa]